MRCPEDMQIYSFAKYFPIQLGGLLVAGSSYRLPKNRIDSATVAEIRRLNHKKLAGRLSKLGLAPRFTLSLIRIRRCLLSRLYKSVSLQAM